MALIQAVLGLIFTLPALYFSFVRMLVNIESWVDRQTLYTGRFHEQEIMLQKLGWEDYHRVVKTRPVVHGLRWVTQADTTNLEASEWMKVMAIQKEPEPLN